MIVKNMREYIRYIFNKDLDAVAHSWRSSVSTKARGIYYYYWMKNDCGHVHITAHYRPFSPGEWVSWVRVDENIYWGQIP